MSAAVVSSGEDSEKLASSESFESIHHTLMSSQNEFSLVVVQELLHSIGSELHNVASSVRVTNEVRLNTQLLIIVSRI